jgi:drug/metabolite transporter (DMT)-like permease
MVLRPVEQVYIETGDSMQKIIGVICLAVGVVLLVWGHNIAQSLNSQVKNIFTGSPTDRVMYYYLGGAVLCAVGLTQILWKRK